MIPFAANAAATAPAMIANNPQNCPFALGFRYPAARGPSHGHSNMHRKNDEDGACGSGDMLADIQTDRHTHIHKPQYFESANCQLAQFHVRFVSVAAM